MSERSKEPVLVVLQLSGGNDFMNTLIPYTSGDYYDARPTVAIAQEDVLPISDTLGFHPNAGPLKEIYDRGKMAIVQGIGYPNSNRSHFRAMDIWHTCEPHEVGTEGWVAKAVRELDPQSENVLTCVSLGKGLPRAVVASGVPVTSVDNLEAYGVMTGITEQERHEALEIFKHMYTPAVGAQAAMDYLGNTGLDVLKGTDMLKKAPAEYESDVEYANNGIAKSLRDVARIHLADLGTRIFYTQHGGYDTHSRELLLHEQLMTELSGAVMDFYTDLEEHGAGDNVAILVFTEFGRRIKDNGSGTDHGSGGGAFIIGPRVKGGLYAEYPPVDPANWLNGEDLRHTIDFRGIYGTMLEQWMGMPAASIVGGAFEQVHPFE